MTDDAVGGRTLSLEYFAWENFLKQFFSSSNFLHLFHYINVIINFSVVISCNYTITEYFICFNWIYLMLMYSYGTYVSLRDTEHLRRFWPERNVCYCLTQWKTGREVTSFEGWMYSAMVQVTTATHEASQGATFVFLISNLKKFRCLRCLE